MILDKSLENLSACIGHKYTFRDLTGHVLVKGQSGSGKTSSTLRQLMVDLALNHCGGIILTSKRSDVDDWLQFFEMLKKKGVVDRTNDIVVFGENENQYSFSPLEYYQSSGRGANTNNIVQLLYDFVRLEKFINGDEGSGKEADFWRNAVKRMLTYSVLLLSLAKKDITFDSLHSLILSIPTESDINQLQTILNDHSSFQEKLQKWGESNYFIECFYEATKNTSFSIQEGNSSRERDYHLSKQYFIEHLPRMHDRTKTIIIESLVSLFQIFLIHPTYQYFNSRPTNLRPEITWEGNKIIILDWSVKEYDNLGRFLQGIYRYMWMRAIERRRFDSKTDNVTFLFADEAPLFLSHYDSIFQATSRSCGAAVISAGQSISAYKASLAGNQHSIDALLANFSTRIYHTNTDPASMNFVANSIGKAWRPIFSHGVSSAGSSSNIQPQFTFQVDPVKVTQLGMGGPPNFESEVLITIAGKTFIGSKNYYQTTIPQILL